MMDLEPIYGNVDRMDFKIKTGPQTQSHGQPIYGNVDHMDFKNKTGPQTQSHSQDKGKDTNHSKQKITLKQRWFH